MITLEAQRPSYVLKKGSLLGFEYVIAHNGLGYRCGYVSIPRSHDWHGKSYNDLWNIEVHGGLTYSRLGTDGEWWLGFDCAHFCDDQDPDLPSECQISYCGGEIRTTEYVEQECQNLIIQAAYASPSAMRDRRWRDDPLQLKARCIDPVVAHFREQTVQALEWMLERVEG